MTYLDFDKLAAMDGKAFRNTDPYPWVNPAALLTDEGYAALLNSMPTTDQMTPQFGQARSHGQKPHDRYSLEYRPGLDISSAWQGFIDELQSDEYHAFIKKMFGRGLFKLNFHWHYAPRGASVSPLRCPAQARLAYLLFQLAGDLVAAVGRRYRHPGRPRRLRSQVRAELRGLSRRLRRRERGQLQPALPAPVQVLARRARNHLPRRHAPQGLHRGHQ